MHHPWPESDPAVMAPVEEHDELRQVVRSVLQKHAGHEQVRVAAESASGYSDTLWRRLNQELEIGRLSLPEERGGHGFGMRELGVLLEETGAALLPEPVLASAVLGARALAAADDADGMADVLASVAAGDLVATVSLNAPSARGSAGGPVLGEGPAGWQVHETVPAVLQGAGADLVILPAVGPEGEVLVLVEAAAARVDPRTVVDLTRRRADVHLAGAPARVLVGPERCAQVLHGLRLVAQAAVAAEHTGIVAELLDRTVEYVADRQQFGRPIGSFQAVKHRLADVLVDLERARSASRYAAAALDEDPGSAELAVAIAAATCSDAAMRTAHEAVQLHGGIGFTWEHRAHYYLRRVLGDEGLLGPSRRHRARIADLVGV